MSGLPARRPCRLCAAPLTTLLLDLGNQPDPDAFVGADDPHATGAPDPTAERVDAWICSSCGLVQLGAPDADSGQPAGGAAVVHGHGSIHSSTLTGAGAAWLGELLGLAVDEPLVVDVAADGREVLDAATDAGRPAIGITAGWGAPAGDGAMAQADVRPGPFNGSVAARLVAETGRAGLVVARHVLAHRDDLGDVLDALAALRAPGGAIALEIHHVAAVATGQFDVISSAHRTYLSLLTLEPALRARGLATVDAERSDLNGGTLRLIVRGAETPAAASVAVLLDDERAARLDRPEGYADLAATTERACADLRSWLEQAAADGRRVAGYGAPARGIVLLNAAGIRPELLAYTVDRSPAKQGRRTPGSLIPVRAPDALDADPPDDVLILTWTIRDEIVAQLDHLRQRGTRFVVAMPRLEVVA
jgi:hypothetical protein